MNFIKRKPTIDVSRRIQNQLTDIKETISVTNEQLDDMNDVFRNIKVSIDKRNNDLFVIKTYCMGILVLLVVMLLILLIK